MLAHTKQTSKVVDEADAADSRSNTVLSFEFGFSRVTSKDLDSFAPSRWFARDAARLSEGETIPKPHEDEVVVYREFFEAGLRFSPHSLVIGVLKRFNLKFHQLNPSSFVKLSIYVWGCKSQGVEPDLEGFIHLHQIHPQPHKVNVDGKTLLCQFGIYTFVFHHGVEFPIQA
jgi:hypothetical protein